MRARQHRQVGMAVRQLPQRLDDAVDGRQHHFVAGRAQHQRMRGVVDVLGSAGEMDELAGGGHFGITGQALLEEVFDRLDVVIGPAFLRLDRLGVGIAEVR